MIRLPLPAPLLCPVPAEVRQNHEVVAKLGWGFTGRVGGAFGAASPLFQIFGETDCLKPLTWNAPKYLSPLS